MESAEWLGRKLGAAHVPECNGSARMPRALATMLMFSIRNALREQTSYNELHLRGNQH